MRHSQLRTTVDLLARLLCDGSSHLHVSWQRSVNVPKAMSYHECQLCRYWLCGSGVVIITPPMPPLTAVLVSKQLFGVPRNETRELSALVVPEVVIMTPAMPPQKMYNSQKLCCHVHKLQQAEVKVMELQWNEYFIKFELRGKNHHAHLNKKFPSICGQ